MCNGKTKYESFSLLINKFKGPIHDHIRWWSWDQQASALEGGGEFIATNDTLVTIQQLY